MKPRFIAFIPAILWLLVTTILLVLPGPDVPSSNFLDKIYFDKWVHTGLFAGLTFLTAFPYLKIKTADKKLLTQICITYIIYGVAMEFVQKYLAFERDFDLFDMVADSAGCLLGIFAVRIFFKRKALIKNKPL